jgi:hypothetical protein
MASSSTSAADGWSQWLDFDGPTIESAPEAAGVFVMHANMKVLYIGGNVNIRQGLKSRLADECCSKAKRFRYKLTPSPDSVRQELLKEYMEKHGGKTPLCSDI